MNIIGIGLGISNSAAAAPRGVGKRRQHPEKLTGEEKKLYKHLRTIGEKWHVSRLWK